MGVKFCPKCSTEKPLSEFFNNKSAKDGLHSYCKTCTKAYDQERYPDGKPGRRKRYYLKTYGLSLEELDQMYEAQAGCCAICEGPNDQLVVDHSHVTGEVRGLLCNNCNRCLGLLKDKISVLASAINYLSAHERVLVSVGD